MMITYSKQAVKILNSLDAQTRQRIRRGIEGIPEGDIKPLQGYADARKRLRIGKYRVVFIFLGEELRIVEIGSRGDIYK